MPTPPEFGPRPLAIVTGGARRIGAALARALHAEGWRLLIHCNRSRDEADALAAELDAEVVGADLAHWDAAETILAAAAGRARLLVNNASRFAHDTHADFSAEDWDAHLNVNLRAPVLLTQAFAAALPPGEHGLVVNLLDAKLSALNPDYFTYTLAKAALATATELAARAFAPAVRVNAIAPAITLTSGPQSRAEFERVHTRNPLRRGVEADSIARALVYLTRQPTTTGQTLTIDAGARFMALPRDVAFLTADHA